MSLGKEFQTDGTARTEAGVRVCLTFWSSQIMQGLLDNSKDVDFTLSEVGNHWRVLWL